MAPKNQIIELADSLNPFSWISMPGMTHRGPIGDLSEEEMVLFDDLQKHVITLSGDIGERHYMRHQSLDDAGDYIKQALTDIGYCVNVQEYKMDGRIYRNFEAELSGTENPSEIIVAGAHYDSVIGSPGANDNATGVAAVLTLAKRLADNPLGRTVRFVTFTNEEDPHFGTEYMGSYVYAKHCYDREDKLIGMLALETMGYYSDVSRTQQYPVPVAGFYPDTGNFIVFVGNTKYKNFVHRCLQDFRSNTKFPSEGVAVPGWITGVSWSDHLPFWQHGYPAVMVTDTALYRYPHYHTPEDTADKVNFIKLARVTAGIDQVIGSLSRGEGSFIR